MCTQPNDCVSTRDAFDTVILILFIILLHRSRNRSKRKKERSYLHNRVTLFFFFLFFFGVFNVAKLGIRSLLHRGSPLSEDTQEWKCNELIPLALVQVEAAVGSHLHLLMLYLTLLGLTKWG